MNKKWYLVALLMGTYFADTSCAELFKYTDNNGTLCFADNLGKVPKKYRKNIIREEEEGAAQTVTSQEAPSLQSPDSRQLVHVCYGASQSAYLGVGGRDVTDFLEARGYPYLFHLAADLQSAKPCYDLWCKWDTTIRYPGTDFNACIKEQQKISDPKNSYNTIFPFMVFNNRVYTRHIDYSRRLDEFFHVDYRTVIKWKD